MVVVECGGFVELEKLGEKRKELAILLGRDKGRAQRDI